MIVDGVETGLGLGYPTSMVIPFLFRVTSGKGEQVEHCREGTALVLPRKKRL